MLPSNRGKAAAALGFVGGGILVFFFIFKSESVEIPSLLDVPHFWRFAFAAFLSTTLGWVSMASWVIDRMERLAGRRHRWTDWSSMVVLIAVLVLWLDKLFDWIVGPVRSVAWRGWLSVLGVLLGCYVVGVLEKIRPN